MKDVEVPDVSFFQFLTRVTVGDWSTSRTSGYRLTDKKIRYVRIVSTITGFLHPPLSLKSIILLNTGKFRVGMDYFRRRNHKIKRVVPLKFKSKRGISVPITSNLPTLCHEVEYE